MKRKIEEKKASTQASEQSPLLNQDIIDTISTYLPYYQGLSFFRQTSKHYNQLIENTRAGKKARKASNLELLNKMQIMLASHFDQDSGRSSGITEMLCGILSAASIIVSSDSFNSSTVGEIMAAGVAGFLGGSFLTLLAHDRDIRNWNRFKLACMLQFCDFYIMFFSVLAGLSGALVGGLSNTLIGFPSEIDTSVCPSHLNKSLSEQGIECTPFLIANEIVRTNITPICLEYSAFFCTLTALTCLGISINERQINAAQLKISGYREQLLEPLAPKYHKSLSL